MKMKGIAINKGKSKVVISIRKTQQEAYEVDDGKASDPTRGMEWNEMDMTFAIAFHLSV